MRQWLLISVLSGSQYNTSAILSLVDLTKTPPPRYLWSCLKKGPHGLSRRQVIKREGQ